MRNDQQRSPEQTDKGMPEEKEAPGLAITARGMGFVPPRLPTRDLQRAALDLFGLRGELHALDGEREQNCRIDASDGAQYVLKVARHDEDPQLIDFQLRALVHLQETAPKLPVPRVFSARSGGLAATLMGEQGQPHTLRLLSYLPGHPLARGPAPSMAALQDIGALQARICLGLRGYFHPAARNFVPWDLSRGLVLHPDLVRGIPAEIQHEVEPVLLRLRTQVLPCLAGLRAQVIHHDAHFGNLLRDLAGGETITGVIDFGDMIHGPLAMELAVSMASVAEAYDDFPAAASLLARGFHDLVPLEAEEIDLLLDLTLARLILTIQLTALKMAELGAASGTEMPAYIAAFRRLAALDPTEFARRLKVDCGLPSTPVASLAEPARLIERRKAALGPAAVLFYEEPVHIVRGRDVWLYDSRGREYLDCYNNVPSVGHCHPRVVNALADQARTLNTHTRYLHETVVRYAEKIAATMPGELTVCFFACTGSEANDLALRIARVVTGANGAIVNEHAYHGTTLAATQLSPSEYPRQDRPDWLEIVAPPDLYRGPFGSADRDVGAAYAGLIGKAVEALGRRGIRPAIFMYDAIFDAAGIHTAPAGYLARAHEAVRAAGGLVVADEVQAGLCRLGEHIWGFQDSGVVPDIVTLGKPMGNGHPIAAVVTTPKIAEAFAAKFSYFNTFAGNPVSAAVGLAVLDVVEEECLLGSVGEAGRYLGTGLQALATRHQAIGDIRGKGLFWGLDMVGQRESRSPAPAVAARVVELMRREGVLIAASGPHRSVLKIRPPLTFRPFHAERLLSALDVALSQITARTNG